MHLLLWDLIKDTPLVESRKKLKEEEGRENPSTRQDSNPRPQEFCSAAECSTAVLQPQPQEIQPKTDSDKLKSEMTLNKK